MNESGNEPLNRQPWSAPDPGAGGPVNYPPYGFAPPPLYPPPAPVQPRRPVPSYVWPAVATIALVMGLAGGGITGALIANQGDADAAFGFGSSLNSTAPLSAKNGSVGAVADKVLPSTVQILAEGAGVSGDGTATGSGFVLDGRGHVITNNHVVAESTEAGDLRVIDADGRSHRASIVGRSPVYDIAVLRVRGIGDLPPAALGSSQSMRIGDTVVAIGSPLGLSSTVTAGIVSAVERPVTAGPSDDSSYINAVQTDAAINPGNSGGPLVNLRGQVIGVNSAIATSGGSDGNIGVGFAIPMEQVLRTAEQILKDGFAQYPIIGATVRSAPKLAGARIVKVPADTPAAAAGLRAEDVVIRADGKPLTDSIGLIVAIRSRAPGEAVELLVRRGDRTLELSITPDAEVDRPKN